MTLQLPRTDFPMRADLPLREPEQLAAWEAIDLYGKIQNKAGGKKYILHDGPPYANGHIHIGHALNKILKDMIVRSKTMSGHSAPYVPGWDCHGLPIEHEVLKAARAKGETPDPMEIRKRCREYAQKFVEIQREEFKRLGILGDWDHPYLTMTPDYEAAIVREFGKVVASGSVYKAKKPVLWCTHDETALAEAEVEYADVTSPSIYVRFRVENGGSCLKSPDSNNAYFVIWTTTPWTLMANRAICLHPDFLYQEVTCHDPQGMQQTLIIAKDRVAACMKGFGIEAYQIVVGGEHKGRDLEGLRYETPLREKAAAPANFQVITGGHVTLDQGTGCVHTAPGHGREDYLVGHPKGCDVFAPVDSRGRFTPEISEYAPEFVGVEVHKANAGIIDRLKTENLLVSQAPISHSYPHCWRCKKPVIFRATEQWFISMEKSGLREAARTAIAKEVTWIPKVGQDRIDGMMQTRPDWCISRQRTWGVPIVAFACTQCEQLLYTPEIIGHVADLMEQGGGSDLWYARSAEALLPAGEACSSCHGTAFSKENAILDVWFESGVSHAAVLKRRPQLAWPADLYLEGSDQHRGWFHSSLLAAILTDGCAPYKAVLTHGFVVDGEGRKMSKSVGNVVSPEAITRQYGADILRLWVASTDFRDDIRISPALLTQTAELYRKIRNTCRFLLGNLSDYDPLSEETEIEEGGWNPHVSPSPRDIDRWALNRLRVVTQQVQAAYGEADFHRVIHLLNTFCAVDLSAFYLDILKDRLYAWSHRHTPRRSAQSVLFQILDALTRLMAPILPFTAEAVWKQMPNRQEPSVHLAHFPEVAPDSVPDPWVEKIEQLIPVRSRVLAHLEKARAEKKIGASLEASVTLWAAEPLGSLLAEYRRFLPELFIVSQVDLLSWEERPTDLALQAGETLGIQVGPARGKKCERCWVYHTEVGASSLHPTLCPRCVGVMKAIGA